MVSDDGTIDPSGGSSDEDYDEYEDNWWNPHSFFDSVMTCAGIDISLEEDGEWHSWRARLDRELGEDDFDAGLFAFDVASAHPQFAEDIRRDIYSIWGITHPELDTLAGF